MRGQYRLPRKKDRKPKGIQIENPKGYGLTEEQLRAVIADVFKEEENWIKGPDVYGLYEVNIGGNTMYVSKGWLDNFDEVFKKELLK